MAKQTFTTGQVLSAAQMTTLQANDYNQTVSAKVASYTLVAADAGTRITMSNASATTITVNTGLFTAGDTLYITNIGAGASTITAGTATVSTASSLVLAQYDSGVLYFTSTGVAIWQKYDGAAAAGGGMTLINTGGTALTGSSVTVSSIPNTYKSLYILVDAVRNTTSGSSASYRFNSDTGTKYVSREYYDTDAQPIQVSTGVQMYNNFSNASPYGTVVIQIPNYTSTGYKLHTVVSAADSHSNAGYSYFYQRNRAYFGSSAISSITFYTSDSFAGGTVYVYGVN
jgi:hypothetical protein